MRTRRRFFSWKTGAVAMAVAIAGAATLPAGPADYLKMAPPGHDVFIYVDVAQIYQSPMYQKLEKQLINPAMQAGLTQLQQLTGMRIPADLDVVAASGWIGHGDEGCVFIRGRWDRPRVESFLSMNPAYTETTVPGGKVLAWLDEDKGEMNYGAFLRDDLAVIGKKASVEAAVTAAGGKSGSMADKPAAKLYAENLASTPVVTAFAVRPETIPPNLAQVPALEKIDSLLVAVYNMPRNLRVSTWFQAASGEIAGEVRDVAEGIVALARLQDRIPKVAELATATRVTQSGTLVSTRTDIPLADAEALIRWQIAKKRGPGPQGGGPAAGAAEPVQPRW